MTPLTVGAKRSTDKESESLALLGSVEHFSTEML